MSVLAERHAWADRAECREHPKEMFFPENLGDRQRRIAAAAAFALCDRCPVRTECLQAAIDADEFDRGIWGGLDPAERRSVAGLRVPTGRPGLTLSLRRGLGQRTPAAYLAADVRVEKAPTPPPSTGPTPATASTCAPTGSRVVTASTPTPSTSTTPVCLALGA